MGVRRTPLDAEIACTEMYILYRYDLSFVTGPRGREAKLFWWDSHSVVEGAKPFSDSSGISILLLLFYYFLFLLFHGSNIANRHQTEPAISFSATLL